MSLYDAQRVSASLINSLRTLIPVLSFLCPVLALLISFNSVNGEIEDGSLKVSLSYPLYRDQIFLGKLLSGFFVTFLTSFSAMLVGFAVYIYLSGVAVNLDLLSRILIIAFSTTLYMMIFFSLGLLFSIYFNNPVKSFLLGVITWIIAIDVYKQVINLAAELLFGIRISNKLSYETFVNICSIFDVNSNYGKILENSLTTLSVISYSAKGFIVNNIYVGAILSTLYNPLTVMLSLIVIINLFSYLLFIRKEVV
jgi:ABC-type transport system involved in multi-copper enzyme maturation permease subunit